VSPYRSTAVWLLSAPTQPRHATPPEARAGTPRVELADTILRPSEISNSFLSNLPSPRQPSTASSSQGPTAAPLPLTCDHTACPEEL
jgi:hypothetical protein